MVEIGNAGEMAKSERSQGRFRPYGFAAGLETAAVKPPPGASGSPSRRYAAIAALGIISATRKDRDAPKAAAS